ncbi:MAG TPA: hypothetical protein VHM64_14245 [Candidatus Binatia bacterium]|nr:hypothetical protein [Candidatus Binatia bacterium]
MAGSVAAMELLKHLEVIYPDTQMARFFATLRTEVAADRGELRVLMNGLQIVDTRPRKAAAWIAGKFTELKLRLDDNHRGPLFLLESLDAIALGIQGKVALWRALNAAAAVNPALRGIIDYQRLENRAKQQSEAVEIVRVEAARAALRQPHSRVALLQESQRNTAVLN